MISSTLAYLAAHPVLTTVLALTIVLAVIGLWYVVYNHFKLILVTALSGAGLLSGIVVLYRGAENEMRDLIGIGLFLTVAFPVIFWQSVKTQKKVATLPQHTGGIRLPGQPPPPKQG